MYMRVVQEKINPDKIQGFRKLYDERIIPALQKLPGCFCASLMQSDQHLDEYISLTLWEQKKHVEAYEQSGLFQKLHAEAKPYLSGSSEWKIQLSEDFTLEYEPVEEEPIVKSFPIVAHTNANICSKEESQFMYMRVVSVKLQPGKLEEFKQLYRGEIIPALRAVKGCLYAYLTESFKEKNEVISVTFWDRKEDADHYEKSGLFDKLTEKVKHTFSELYQWKLALEKDLGKILATSEDLKVNYYSTVTGKRFK